MSASNFQRQGARTQRREGCHVAQVSKPAVSPISKSAWGARSCGLRVWKPAIQQTWKSTRRRSAPGAAPAPFLRAAAESGRHRIVSDVAGNPRFLVRAPNPVMVGFRLPERFFAHAHNFLGAARGKLVPRFQNVAQQIPAVVKMPHRVGDDLGNIRSAQMTSTRTAIQVALNFSAKVARDFFFGVVNGFTSLRKIVQATHSFRFFPLELQPDFLGQRVGQSKRDKVGSAFALYMRKVAPVVNAGAKWIGGFTPHSAGANLMARALQARIRLIGFVGLQGGRLAKRVDKSEFRSAGFQTCCTADFQIGRALECSKRVERVDIAQVWKPATQQTWKSALHATRLCVK
jgi:hypothetical protein